VITLDLFLPDMDGWRVLTRLKRDMATRHIPVCVISTDESRDRALQAGAFAFLPKPVQSREVLDAALQTLARYVDGSPRKLLVAMPESPERDLFAALLPADQVESGFASTREQLIAALTHDDPAAVVVAGELFENGADEIEAALAEHAVLSPLPVIVCSPQGAVPRARALAGERFIARAVPDVNRLLDAAVSLLHVNRQRLPDPARQIIDNLHGGSGDLTGRKALIVDDDMRNIFALATVLEDYGMRHVWADNGPDAIRLVEADPEIEIVLMDIMMPEMDGLATTREIRKRPVGHALPIIAVTAKAMKGDRERCIEAGAWDYLSKPVNREDLFAVLHAWLHRQET